MIRPKRSHRYSYKPVHPPKFPKPPDQMKTLGGGDCWCGKPGNHTWEGEADGAPHPR